MENAPSWKRIEVAPGILCDMLASEPIARHFPDVGDEQPIEIVCEGVPILRLARAREAIATGVSIREPAFIACPRSCHGVHPKWHDVAAALLGLVDGKRLTLSPPGACEVCGGEGWLAWGSPEAEKAVKVGLAFGMYRGVTLHALDENGLRSAIEDVIVSTATALGDSASHHRSTRPASSPTAAGGPSFPADQGSGTDQEEQ